MNLVKKKGKKQQKQPEAQAAAPEMESFDDFLNTLSDDEDEDDDDSQQSGEEEEVDSSEGGEELNGAVGAGSDEGQEVDEEENVEGEEEEEQEEDEELEKDEDDDSLDLNAELEKSLQNEKATARGGRVTEEAGAEESDDDVDYFLREEEPDDEETKEETAASLKKSLAALQETDPDFFAYLKENDEELLNFGASDEERDESEEEEEDKGVHVPPAELEVASDSEAESEEEQAVDKSSAEYRTKVANYLLKRIVNLSVVSHWEQQLSTTRDLSVFAQVVDAFESAVETVLQDKEGSAAALWKVEGSSNFNALIRLCIRHMFSFCTRYLCATNNASFAAKSFTKTPMDVRTKNEARWVKLRPRLRAYMDALVQFLRSMGNPEAITSVLRHCQTMAGFWALFTTKAHKLVRTLIGIWSAGEDSARIAAFVTILRMANYNQDFFLDRVLKQMYIAFVSNSKFTTPSSWPAINFMRASLVEIYLLDTRLAYTIAFPFVRQLAIHLRNATMAGSEGESNTNAKASGAVAGESGGGKAKEGKGKQRNRGARSRGVSADGVLGSKKEATRIVVSWQFLHSIHLWAQLLGEATTKGDESLKLLVHPVVQIAKGVVKLVPTRKFIPLRFHIARILTELQAKTGAFIPILPLALQVLSLTDFSGKVAAKFSVRPLNLQCCLKADPAETGYHKAVADAIYDTILGVCQVLGSDIAFPELMTQPMLILKTFLRNKCKNAEVARRFKTLLEKVEANAAFVSEKRAAAMDAGLVHLGDEKSVQVLRIEIENSHPPPPIIAFAQEWRQMHAKQMAKLQRAAVAGGGGKRGGDGGDETREERLIPKSSSSSKAGKRSQGSKKRAQLEKVLFADDEDDDGASGGSGDDDFGEGGSGDQEEFRTKFDIEDEADVEPVQENESQSKKAKKQKQKPAAAEDIDEEDSEPKKKKAKKVKNKQKGKKSKGQGASKGKAAWEDEDDGMDLQDEIVDFDDFEDSD